MLDLEACAPYSRQSVPMVRTQCGQMETILPDFGRLQRFDVGFGHLLHGQVVAQAPGRIARAFFLAQHAERDAGVAQHARQRQHDLAPLRIVSAHAAQPEAIFLRAVVNRQRRSSR